jgi:glycosyltransferase involved in cell wall biosynthesis
MKILYFCRKRSIKTIHSHGRGAGIYTRALKFFGFTIIHTYHGIHQEPGIKGKIKVSIDRFLERFTDKIILVSEDEFDLARKNGLAILKEPAIIHNGIKPLIRKQDFTHQKVIGTLSRLTFQKGLDNLIQHFYVLTQRRKISNITLKIAGSGEDENKLRSLIKSLQLESQIELVGEIHDPQAFLESLDVYVSCSRWEGLPLAVLEAMSLKIPCVLSIVSGHQYFINNHVAAGFATPETFSEEIEKLLLNPTHHLNASCKSHSFFKFHHTIDKQVIETLKIYSKYT